MHIVARAKTYLSAKISVTDIFIESRPVENDILVPSYIVGKVLPHIVLRFILSLNSELSYLSIQHLKLRKVFQLACCSLNKLKSLEVAKSKYDDGGVQDNLIPISIEVQGLGSVG